MDKTVSKIVEEREQIAAEEGNKASFPVRLAWIVFGWLRYEGQLWRRVLGHPALFVLVLGGLLALVLAWQVPFAYKIDPKSELALDEPFLHNFNKTESTPRNQPDWFYYRWSLGSGSFEFPGVGKHDYIFKLRTASDPNPAPNYTIYANQTLIAAGKFEPGAKDYEFNIPASALMGKNGDLELRFELKPFKAPGDSRDLGFALLSAELQARDNGLTIPPPLQLGYLLGVIGLVYLICGRAGFGGWTAAGAGGFFALVLAYVVATPGARIWLTLFTPQLTFALGLALFFVVLADLFMRRVWSQGWERAWVLSIFGLALAIKLAGALHPHDYMVDIGFHVNNFIALWQNGEWFRQIQSNEWGGRYTYYPPTTYAFAGLFQWLISDKILLLKIWMIVLESTRALLVYYLVKRATGDGRAGVIAAFLIAVMPVGVISISFGQVANLFGEWLMLVALCLVAAKYEQLRRPPWFIALTLVLLATFVQHPGVILLAGMVFLLIIILMRFTGEGRRSWLALLGCYLLALVLSFGIYHWKTVQDMVPQAVETFNAKLQGKPTLDAKGREIKGWQVGGSVHDPRLGLEIERERVTTIPALIGGGLKGFWREAQAYFAVFPLLFALLGLGWLWRISRLKPAPTGEEDDKIRLARRRLFWMMVAWLATGLFFALVGLFLNLYVRYSLFLLPFVAICAGLGLSRLWKSKWEGSRWAGIALTVALGLYLTITTLAMYYDRIIYYGHGA